MQLITEVSRTSKERYVRRARGSVQDMRRATLDAMDAGKYKKSMRIADKMSKRREIVKRVADKLGINELHETKGFEALKQQTDFLTDPRYRALLQNIKDKQEAERKRRERERDGPPIRNKYNPYEMIRRELKMDILRQAIGLGPKKPPKTELKTVWRPRPQNPPRYTYR